MNLVAIIIVNFRTAALTVQCLRSIVADGWLPGRGGVTIVDNASGDDSVEVLRQAVANGGWQDWVEVVPAERNGGFAYGNNMGIRRELEGADRPNYFLMLNPDTVVRPGAIESLVRFMDQHPTAGIVGARLLDEDGTAQCSAHRFPSALGELEGTIRLGLASRLLARWRVSPPVQQQAHECDWVSGAAFLIRRAVIEQIGPMDEKFFLYFEEVDWCRRAKLAGWQVWYVPQSQVMHMEGISTGITESQKRRARYWYDSRRRYFRKHHGMGGLIVADLMWSVGRAAYSVQRWLRLSRTPDNSPRCFARDLIWGDLKALVVNT